MDILDKEFPIPLNRDMTRLATTVIFFGAILIRLLNWLTTGWVLVALGLIMLWLAYQMAIAPYTDEVTGHPEHQQY
jgi:hypothetical protein